MVSPRVTIDHSRRGGRYNTHSRAIHSVWKTEVEAEISSPRRSSPGRTSPRRRVADLHLYATTSMLTSGTYDGVPPTILEPFPNICAVRKAVRSMDVVKAWYAEHPAKSPAYGEL
ncbi:hypothetical protein NFJ02_40g106120 [Pycnococcus provasolii]